MELYTADSNMKVLKHLSIIYNLYLHCQEIIDHLSSRDVRLTCVNLVDSHHCSDAGKFVSVCLTSLTSMLQIALPHVNILSKVVEDTTKSFNNLDDYCCRLIWLKSMGSYSSAWTITLM